MTLPQFVLVLLSLFIIAGLVAGFIGSAKAFAAGDTEYGYGFGGLSIIGLAGFAILVYTAVQAYA